ncbi:hypothetical protein CcaCcLH18_07685 [Colletotrichum camelliae]|nr:hypothetical protein CcaCcLH18_07685 [Colletotrichum camelliae]
MDPVTAIGLASSILAFVEFSFKVVSGTLEVVKSGNTAENAHVGVIVDDLYDVAGGLQNRLRHSTHADALNGLASECVAISEDIKALLQRLKVEAGSSKWKAVSVTIRSMRKKGDVAEMEKKLDRCRSQIMLRLLMILSEKQTGIQVQLTDFRSQSHEEGSNIVHQLQKLRDDILKDSKVSPDISGDGLVGRDIDQTVQMIKEVRTSVDALLNASVEPSPEFRILKQLYFNGIHSRQETLSPAARNTFRWMLEEDFDGEDEDFDWRYGSDGEIDKGEDSNNNDSDSDAKQSQDNTEGDTGASGSDHPDNNEDAPESSEDFNITSYKSHAAEKRSQARNLLFKWLGNDHGVFHISGKAGSGKSTLMKFLLESPITLARLRDWAGDKQLVFGHFFFWKAGSTLQKSLEGLHRSILFECLKQCPDLIERVFPQAYSSFSRNGSESSIDELYFGPQNVETGMKRLISESTKMQCKICFFIDGLDEYDEDDADEFQQEKLAQSMVSWGESSMVKIVASSRPYRIFQEIFQDDLRVKLHELTSIDILLFSRKMFEDDRCFPRIQDHYKKLADRIVRESSGVFLWARFVVRSLIMATRRSCDIKSLEEHLDQTPKSITKIYEQLLASIIPSHRDKAVKMLLLVAKLHELNESVAPIVFTWVNSLDDPNFPMSCKMESLTWDEMHSSQAAAQTEVEDWTRGLLEVSGTGSRDNPKEVRFFHRTVLDFVRESQFFRDMSKQYPDFTNDEVAIRVSLAGIWLIGLPRETDQLSLERALCRVPPSKSRDRYLDAVETVIYHPRVHRWNPLHRSWYAPRGGSVVYYYSEDPIPFFNWLAGIDGTHEYIRLKTKDHPDLLHAKDDLSLILSASFRTHDYSPGLLTNLFALGISPNESVKLEVHDLSSAKERVVLATAWMIFCATFAMGGQLDFVGDRMSWCTALEEFLRTGAVDTEMLILGRYGNQKDQDAESSGPASLYSISLVELVEILNPCNKETLMHLLERPNRSFLSTLRRKWDYAWPPKNDLAALRSSHPPYDGNIFYDHLSPVESITNTGPIQAPNGWRGPTGRHVNYEFMTAAYWQEGRIVIEHLWMDLVTMERQMGFFPSPVTTDGTKSLTLSPYTIPLAVNPSANTSEANKASHQKFETALNDGQFNSESLMLSPNVTVFTSREDTPNGLNGDQFFALINQLQKSFSNVHLSPQVIFGSGDWTASVARLRGNLTNVLAVPEYISPTPIAASNHGFDSWFYTIARWQDGKITHLKFMADVLGILSQGQ